MLHHRTTVMQNSILSSSHGRSIFTYDRQNDRPASPSWESGCRVQRTDYMHEGGTIFIDHGTIQNVTY
eukprot:5924932-Pleurochrysis_carterae.AAC.1